MKTALIVDDTKNIRLLLSHCLRDANFTVYCASNGNEALELISSTHLDIAFIDVKMPNMSGTALLEQVIKDGYNFNVVIMTAFGTIKNAVTTTKLGAMAYLQKPFTANTIRKVLSEIFPDYNTESSHITLESSKITTNDIKLCLNKISTDPLIYNQFGDLLIAQGETEKGNLFKEFSSKLKKLK
ncbi:response regulator [Clostridium uliginosum]|uniref:Stage 0 sporulation protein A homolog n=1 Tax=Clostridium uliginosum TaxID=119641 RepID=A0A1I1KTP2_9CLOT|nr:response regulator [Clostridium uliginosum]SFC64187.1 Response regulator receiver domain-containing protein [Clostridium uliginosum]